MNWVTIQSFELTSHIMIHEFTTDRWAEWMDVKWACRWNTDTGALCITDTSTGRVQYVTPTLTRYAVEKVSEVIVERPAAPAAPPPRLPDPNDEVDEHGNKQVYRSSRRKPK